MKFMVFILLVLYALGLAQPTQKGTADSAIELSAWLEKSAVPLDEEVKYYIQLSWKGDLNDYNIIKSTEPALTNLKLFRSGSSNRILKDEAGELRAVKQIVLHFKPLEMGMAYVDGVTVQYMDSETGKINSLLAQRLEAKIVEPLEKSGKLYPLYGWIFIAIFLITALVLILRYFKKQKQKRQTLTEPEEQLSLQDQYLSSIKVILNEANIGIDEKFDRLMKTFIRYCSKLYKIEGEVSLKRLKVQGGEAVIDESLSHKLSELFKRAELTRFAGEAMAENELHLFYDTIELFIQKTKK
jgi:hypothetical protein